MLVTVIAFASSTTFVVAFEFALTAAATVTAASAVNSNPELVVVFAAIKAWYLIAAACCWHWNQCCPCSAYSSYHLLVKYYLSANRSF